MITPADLAVVRLGPCAHPSPLNLSHLQGDGIADYTEDDDRVVLDIRGRSPELTFEAAGPRSQVWFAPDTLVAGIVSCGGLCPGINNIIRSLVLQLWHAYGVRRIYGFKYGYLGMTAKAPFPPVPMDPAFVESIQHEGGTILGSSRGNQDPGEMVDTLVRMGVNAFFCIGGDGTQRGARAIWDEISRRNLPIAVVGIPKTIDNDIPFIERTFGFETAVAKATEAIHAAHIEAWGAPNGIGLVKLMGRNSGFIAASATLSSGEVNLVLVPEVPFELEGLVAFLRRRLQERDHAVVVVAEGAGQGFVSDGSQRDASGNVKLGDIGLFLRDHLKRAFGDLDVNLKYIDPSYIIRAQPAHPGDAVFCAQLAENAVHAAMSGRTGLVIGLWAGRFTHLPLPLATSERKLLSLDGALWRSVVESTGQPVRLTKG